MNWILGLLVAWVITTVAMFIISKLPVGVEIDGVQKALVSAAAFGILNAILFKVLNFATFGLLTGVIALVVNVLAFGLAAWAIEGFRLRWGFWSALIGAFLLSIITSFLTKFLATVI